MILSVFCVSVNGKISLRSIFPWEHGIIDLRVGKLQLERPPGHKKKSPPRLPRYNGSQQDSGWLRSGAKFRPENYISHI